MQRGARHRHRLSARPNQSLSKEKLKENQIRKAEEYPAIVRPRKHNLSPSRKDKRAGDREVICHKNRKEEKNFYNYNSNLIQELDFRSIYVFFRSVT